MFGYFGMSNTENTVVLLVFTLFFMWKRNAPILVGESLNSLLFTELTTKKMNDTQFSEESIHYCNECIRSILLYEDLYSCHICFLDFLLQSSASNSWIHVHQITYNQSLLILMKIWTSKVGIEPVGISREKESRQWIKRVISVIQQWIKWMVNYTVWIRLIGNSWLWNSI